MWKVNVPWQTKDNIQESLEEHEEEPKALTWPPISPYPNPVENLWDATEPMMEQRRHPHPTGCFLYNFVFNIFMTSSF